MSEPSNLADYWSYIGLMRDASNADLDSIAAALKHFRKRAPDITDEQFGRLHALGRCRREELQIRPKQPI